MGPRKRAISLSADWDHVFGKSRETKGQHLGFEQVEKPPHAFCTRSVYTGTWNGIGMAGFGSYLFPHGVVYDGFLDDNQFHGDGVLEYPMGQKIEGRWNEGLLESWKFRFTDGLIFELPWHYCIYPDRRYFICINEGLRPAGRELLTNDYQPRKIPEGCYDTGDGFYNPKIKCVVSAYDMKKVLRIPSVAEERWIMDNCRKAWDEPVGYKPDLYPKWTSGRSTEAASQEESTSTETDNSSIDLTGDFNYSEPMW